MADFVLPMLSLVQINVDICNASCDGSSNDRCPGSHPLHCQPPRIAQISREMQGLALANAGIEADPGIHSGAIL